MDRFAHSAANLLVGNEHAAATLECTLVGPRLIALDSCLLAITGGDLDPRVNGTAIPMWTSIALAPGDEMSFGGRRSGARAYIAIAGGVVGDRWLGSMSTNLLCARGGIHGRALIAGDVVSAGDAIPYGVYGRTLTDDRRPRYDDHVLRMIPGPHVERLTRKSRELLYGSPFALGRDSNRMGYRLEGPRLEAPGEEVLSFGVVPGSLQLPIGGQPILLMADHQTAGGYPVMANVVSGSMPVAAQLAPGDELRFAEVTIEEALRERTAQRAALESLTN